MQNLHRDPVPPNAESDDEFIGRAELALDEARRTGQAHAHAEVMTGLRAKLEARRRQLQQQRSPAK